MKLKNKELDKFYTNEEVAKKMIKKINLDLFDIVIEPSAGNGSFSKNINHPNLIAIDILPEDVNIDQGDWFEYEVPQKYKNALVIGNPPFGKMNKLSIQFLKKAFSFESVKMVAFVLPNVYRKYTMQKHIPKDFYINEIIELPENSFTINNEVYHVPCSFFIFSKLDTKDLRQNVNISSSHFEFGTKENFDFFVFGAAPHKVIDKPNKNNRGYYIKTKISKEKVMNNFKKIKWKGHSSANGGVSWYTKVDLIENYEKGKTKCKKKI